MTNLRWKTICRLDGIQRHFRIGRLAWERGVVGDGNGYSVKLAFGLWLRLFRWQRDARCDVLICILGLRVHYSRSYGGRFAATA